LRWSAGVARNLEASRSLKTGEQFAALRRPVHVHPRQPAVIHVQIHRIAEDDELQNRRQKQHQTHARLAEALPELLANDLSQSAPHQATFCRILRVANAKTMAAYATRNSSSVPSARSPTPLRNTPLSSVTK